MMQSTGSLFRCIQNLHFNSVSKNIECLIGQTIAKYKFQLYRFFAFRIFEFSLQKDSFRNHQGRWFLMISIPNNEKIVKNHFYQVVAHDFIAIDIHKARKPWYRDPDDFESISKETQSKINSPRSSHEVKTRFFKHEENRNFIFLTIQFL